jgi:hypothetical protein
METRFGLKGHGELVGFCLRISNVSSAAKADCELYVSELEVRPPSNGRAEVRPYKGKRRSYQGDKA